jgi:hypothetical protein
LLPFFLLLMMLLLSSLLPSLLPLPSVSMSAFFDSKVMVCGNGIDIRYQSFSYVVCGAPRLRGHGDSQTVVFLFPKTTHRHFHQQKVLCDDANFFTSASQLK